LRTEPSLPFLKNARNYEEEPGGGHTDDNQSKAAATEENIAIHGGVFRCLSSVTPGTASDSMSRNLVREIGLSPTGSAMKIAPLNSHTFTQFQK
jgi:hypothetical protein